MSNNIRRLSLLAFTAWLSSKHERTKVGVSCEEDFCPLAKFLTQTTGIPHRVDGETYAAAVLVDGEVMKDSDGDVVYGEETALPQWAQDFINRVDGDDDDGRDD